MNGKIKKKMTALLIAFIMVILGGCGKEKNDIPVPKKISQQYQHLDQTGKYIISNGEAIKIYNSKNVYLLFNKDTYDVSEFLFYGYDILWGLGKYAEVYDLPSETLLVYCNGINNTINGDYYSYLIENNYQVCLLNVCDYVEGHTLKEFYTIDEIREMEPIIAEGLKKINAKKKLIRE